MLKYNKKNEAREVETIKDEFTHFNEYNKTTEYQKFPAELYKKNKEENSAGLEQANLGKEVTTLQTSSQNKNGKNSTSGLLNKIFNSLKSCATVTAVATVAVVGASTIAPSPSVELNNLLVNGTYIEYELSVQELSSEKDYSIIISTTNQEDWNFPVNKDGVYQNKVEGLKPEWEYNLSFVSFDEYLGKTVLFNKTFQTKKENPPIEQPTPPTLPDYKIEISDITVVGLNEVDICFETDKLDEKCKVELLITYGDGTNQTVTIDEECLIDKRVRVLVSGNTSISVTPILILNDGEDSIEFAKYEHTFTENLNAEVVVGLSQKAINFQLKALLNGATHAEIVDESTGATIYSEQLWGSIITYYYTIGSTPQPTYTLYLTDEFGQRLSNGYSITFNSEYANDTPYSFNYKNPGEVGITYNDDGTINVYIQTDFSCDNANLFYMVSLDDLHFKSTEPIFSAIGIPNKSYALTYDVCVEVDGIIYSINNIVPSGMVNEYGLSSFIFANAVQNGILLEIYSHQAQSVDFSSVRIVISNGQEFTVNENDWVLDSINDVYTCTIEIPNEFEFFDVYATIGPNKDRMENITEYQGSLDAEFTERIYK